MAHTPGNKANSRLFSFRWRSILPYFLQGLVVIAPLALTAYAVVWLFDTVDNILPNILNSLFPALLVKDATGTLKAIPGLGFLVVVIIVVFVGWISSSFFVSRLFRLVDRLLERTPGIKFIYGAVRDFFEAFAGNKRKFDKPVLVNIEAPDVWRMGFMTQEDASSFGMKDFVVVYLPHSYAVSGITYLVPPGRVRLLEGTSAADAMKFIISGGVVDHG